MNTTIRTLAVAALLILPVTATAQTEPTCEELRCALQETLAQECTCDEAGNHGQHVRCVAHAVNALARSNDIPKNCGGKIKRCAARSTCGKPGRTTCLIPTEDDSCDLTTGLCVNDGVVPCTTDLECIDSFRCKIARSAEQCADRGGYDGGAGTCCSRCEVAAP